MTELFDTIALAAQLAGGAAILYGAVLALELDVLLDKMLKPRRLALRTAPSA